MACPAGTLSRQTGAGSAAVCVACPAGAYCSSPGASAPDGKQIVRDPPPRSPSVALSIVSIMSIVIITVIIKVMTLVLWFLCVNALLYGVVQAPVSRVSSVTVDPCIQRPGALSRSPGMGPVHRATTARLGASPRCPVLWAVSATLQVCSHNHNMRFMVGSIIVCVQCNPL